MSNNTSVSGSVDFCVMALIDEAQRLNSQRTGSGQTDRTKTINGVIPRPSLQTDSSQNANIVGTKVAYTSSSQSPDPVVFAVPVTLV
jgi:hypothetical protein